MKVPRTIPFPRRDDKRSGAFVCAEVQTGISPHQSSLRHESLRGPFWEEWAIAAIVVAATLNALFLVLS